MQDQFLQASINEPGEIIKCFCCEREFNTSREDDYFKSPAGVVIICGKCLAVGYVYCPIELTPMTKFELANCKENDGVDYSHLPSQQGFCNLSDYCKAKHGLWKLWNKLADAKGIGYSTCKGYRVEDLISVGEDRQY